MSEPFEVTAADREKAMRALGITRPWASLTEAVAAALASERAATVANLRARLEAVAEELEAAAMHQPTPLDYPAHLLRRAASLRALAEGDPFGGAA